MSQLKLDWCLSEVGQKHHVEVANNLTEGKKYQFSSSILAVVHCHKRSSAGVKTIKVERGKFIRCRLMGDCLFSVRGRLVVRLVFPLGVTARQV